MGSLLLFVVIALVVGLLFGSFLNVCISRLPRGESVVTPRSRCPQCGVGIPWYDNIPLLSFVVLRGRCRGCRGRIAWRYPVVELATGAWFAAQGARLYRAWMVPGLSDPARALDPAILLSIGIVGAAVLGFLLIGLMVIDWETQRLPDAFTLPGIAIGFLLVCVQAVFLGPGENQILLPAEHMRLRSPGVRAVEGNLFMTGPEAVVLGRLGAIVLAAGLLLSVRWLYRRLRGREGMGLGDVKLLAMIAAFLGLAQTLLALFAGVVAAAGFAAILLARRRAELGTRLPFGSFLAGGGLLAAGFGPGLLAWYTALFP